jgi:branched-chain amino acid transport system permease protein
VLQYIFAGLALGAIYAIASSSLVITFVSAGVLNFAFGSMAYVGARFYYWLNSQHGWGTDTAGAVSILVFSPLMGIVLYVVLFRFVRGKSTLVKLVATIGLSVALPAIADTVLGTQTVTNAPGLASLTDRTHHFLGAPITSDTLITYGFLVFVLVAGTAILRFTDLGLRVRAMVDSEAMSSLSGSDPGRTALGVWAVSAALAGLAGILVAPTDTLTPSGMTTLMAAAFAAVVVARLRSLPGAVGASLLMGVFTDVIQKYLPANSSFTAAILPSIPFAFILVALIFYVVRSGSLQDGMSAGGPLDEAIKPAADTSDGPQLVQIGNRKVGAGLSSLPILAVAVLPLIFHGSSFWLQQAGLGLAYAVTFLTFTVVTGEGGMLWLSQIIFAGAGALATAQFATKWHVPVLLAVVMGGVVAAAAGAVLGFLTIRLGDLYVGLVTLTFGLLVEQLVFTRFIFLQGGAGVVLNRPSFAQGNTVFAYLTLAVFVVLALVTLNLRRSTSGMALRAVRDSDKAARTIGLSVVQVKVIVGALAAFIAAVGGGFLAMQAQSAQPQDFDTFAGLVWLAVVVAIGVRSITGAALAGVSFALLPAVFQTHVPTRWDDIPVILFGLGAIGVARNPEGVVAQTGRQIRQVMTQLISRRGPSGTRPPLAPPAPGSSVELTLPSAPAARLTK